MGGMTCARRRPNGGRMAGGAVLGITGALVLPFVVGLMAGPAVRARVPPFFVWS
jgi:hypothetical protein